jgi:ATP-dependent DNA helicase RecQ
MLLYSYGDRRIQEFFIESAYPAREVVQQVYDHLRRIEQEVIELTQQEIKDRLGLQVSAEGVGACEQLLEQAGVLERLESRENMARVKLDSDLPTLVDLLPRQAKAQRRLMQAIERFVGSVRHEWVDIPPRELMAALETDSAALSRTLRELKSLQAFDYIPPFRGRAIRMLVRDQPFQKLDLDFKTLEEHKEAEYEKLNRMIAFAETSRCREREILAYFGQENAEPCGRCDNCQRRGLGRRQSVAVEALSHAGLRAPPESASVDESSANEHEVPNASAQPLCDELVEVIRKILSGVARTRGRFGKNVIAQMLCGSNNAKIKKFGLARLSTYGLLAHFKQDEVVELLDMLLTLRCLEQAGADGLRPTVQLTEFGTSVMTAQSRLESVLPLSPALARRFAPSKAAKPKEPPRKVEGSMNGGGPAPAPAAIITQPNHYWTWRLLTAGFTVDECMAIRGCDREVVLDHALRAAEAGWQVDVSWLLSAETVAQIAEVIGPAPPPRIRPLLAKLPGVRYEEVQFFLKCRPAE